MKYDKEQFRRNWLKLVKAEETSVFAMDVYRETGVAPEAVLEMCENMVIYQKASEAAKRTSWLVQSKTFEFFSNAIADTLNSYLKEEV